MATYRLGKLVGWALFVGTEEREGEVLGVSLCEEVHLACSACEVLGKGRTRLGCGPFFWFVAGVLDLQQLASTY